MKQRAMSLAELGALREALQAAQRRASEAAEQQRRREREAERARRAFADAVGTVTLLPPHDRVTHIRVPPPAVPAMRQRDEQEALREALSDEVDLESLLLTDDGLSFRRSRVGPDVLTRLRRGHWAVQAELDLHGLRRDEARDALAAFVRQALARGQRCLRVVHGKGHGSPGREPVLKAKVQRWLAQHQAVIAFAQAAPAMGGAGALIVLLG